MVDGAGAWEAAGLAWTSCRRRCRRRCCCSLPAVSATAAAAAAAGMPPPHARCLLLVAPPPALLPAPATTLARSHLLSHLTPPPHPPRRYDGHNGGWSPALTINKVALSLRSMLARWVGGRVVGARVGARTRRRHVPAASAAHCCMHQSRFGGTRACSRHSPHCTPALLHLTDVSCHCTPPPRLQQHGQAAAAGGRGLLRAHAGPLAKGDAVSASGSSRAVASADACCVTEQRGWHARGVVVGAPPAPPAPGRLTGLVCPSLPCVCASLYSMPVGVRGREGP